MSSVRVVLIFALFTAACAVDVSGLPNDGAVSSDCTGDEDCIDGVDCTDDTCGADGVCVFTEVDSRCASGEVCLAATGCQPESDCNADDCADALRVALTCQVGACQGDGTCLGESTCAAGESCCGDGTCMDCDDGNPCTADSCDPSGCVNTPLDGTACDDGDFCSGTEVCVAGTCESSGDPCVAPTVCNVDRCVGCRNDGDCPGDIIPPYGSCEWSDVCDNRSVRRRTVTSFACVAEECVGSDTEDTDDCMRNTNGDSCGSDSVGGWTSCGSFSNTCDETGSRTRERTTFTCGGGSCGSSTADETGMCNRDTDGTMCMPTNTPSWGACGEFDDDCDETGTQRRTITTFDCAGGSCEGTNANRSRGCTRNTDGDTGCGTPRADMVTTCIKSVASDPCSREGNRTRTTYGTMCMDESCVDVPSTMTESCMVPNTDGDACGGSGPCAGECNGGSCDNSVNDGATCGGSGPCAGACDAGSCDMAANNGDSCGSGPCPGACSGGSCDLTDSDGDSCGSGPCPGACSGGSCDLSDSDGDTCDDGIGCTNADGTCSGGMCSMGSDDCGGSDCAGCGAAACDCRDSGGGNFMCACP